jgi:hypothetical protein
MEKCPAFSAPARRGDSTAETVVKLSGTTGFPDEGR